MTTPSTNRAVQRAYSQVRTSAGQILLTDLTKTELGAVQNRFFRLFVPVKRSRLRLPTGLPEFSGMRHLATLSDSPVLAASRLGGHWSDHNLAAICHVAACNLRCPYCYVEFRHLSAQDGFPTTAAEVVRAFVALRRERRQTGEQLSILRISGGEPLLVPEFIADVHDELRRHGLAEACLLKVESNMTAFAYALDSAPAGTTARLHSIGGLAVHVTIHPTPDDADWPRVLLGLRRALEIGLDVYPAIGGAGWSDAHLSTLFAALAELAPDLPLRLAVRPFNLSYDALTTRRGLDRYAVPAGPSPSMRWEQLTAAKRGRRYLQRPRHLVSLADLAKGAAS